MASVSFLTAYPFKNCDFADFCCFHNYPNFPKTLQNGFTCAENCITERFHLWVSSVPKLCPLSKSVWNSYWSSWHFHFICFFSSSGRRSASQSPRGFSVLPTCLVFLSVLLLLPCLSIITNNKPKLLSPALSVSALCLFSLFVFLRRMKLLHSCSGCMTSENCFQLCSIWKTSSKVFSELSTQYTPDSTTCLLTHSAPLPSHQARPPSLTFPITTVSVQLMPTTS